MTTLSVQQNKIAVSVVDNNIIVSLASAGIQGAKGDKGDTGAAGGIIKINFAYGDASPAIVYTANNQIIAGVTIGILTPFNGTGSSLKVGDATISDRLMKTTENDPYTAAEYESSPLWVYNSSTQILLTITPGGGCTTGSGFVLIEAL